MMRTAYLVRDRLGDGGASGRSLKMLLTMPAMLAAAAIVPIVAASSGSDGEAFVDGAAAGPRVWSRRWRFWEDVVLAAAGVLAIALSTRAFPGVSPATLWLLVVVPLWLLSVVRHSRGMRREA